MKEGKLMYYFFPAWYEHEKSWQSPRIPWYFTGQKIEFDETIHQVRILNSQNVPLKLMLLSYIPQLRYHLHRHDMYEIPHISLFDDLQGITSVESRTLQIDDFEWDEWCEFVYTPFVVSVYRFGKHFATIEFTQESIISHLNFYENDQLIRTQIYDDRGFLSSVIVYENGQFSSHEFFNAEGMWQFRLLENGQIIVNPQLSYKFMSLTYSSFDLFIEERLRIWIGIHLKNGDQVILPSAFHHETTVLPLLPDDVSLVTTTFIERQSRENFLALKGLIRRSKAILVDRQDTTQYLKEQLPMMKEKIHYMPAFDTRLRLGVSQQNKMELLYFHVNPQDFSMEMIIPVLQYVTSNQFSKLKLGIINADIAPYQEQIESWLDKYKIDLFANEKVKDDKENLLPGEEEWQKRIEFIQLMSELDVIKTLDVTRLVIDFSRTPDVYIQIASISAGIPQINLVETEYVKHLENGYIIQNPQQFNEPAHYYLDQLKYWNEALVHAIEKIRENTGNRFVEKWQRATESRG